MAISFPPVSIGCLRVTIYLQFSIQILSRDGIRVQHLCRRALEHHFATLAPGSGTYVNHVISAEHHVSVVFYHNDSIAQVSQFFQRVYQPVVVALVETDAGLVEDI